MKDELSGEEVEVYARVVLNASGPFTDHLRKLADPSKPEIILPSSGVHVMLPDYYSPDAVGMIVPKTKVGSCSSLIVKIFCRMEELSSCYRG